MKNTLKFQTDNGIYFIPETHEYFSNKNDKKYTSASHVYGSFKEDFDAEGMSYNVARSKLGWHIAQHEDILVVQQEILADWKEKNRRSIEWGCYIDGGLEFFFKNGYHEDKEISKLGRSIYSSYFSGYKKMISQMIVYCDQYETAGTLDIAGLRKVKADERHFLDIYDFKTNTEKGIEFDSIKVKDDGTVKDYERFYLPPFDHLEQCNYTDYTMQLSIYAAMLQLQYGYRIGKLAIIFINKDMTHFKIPIAYMRYEAEEMMRLVMSKHNKLPAGNSTHCNNVKEQQIEW